MKEFVLELTKRKAYTRGRGEYEIEIPSLRIVREEIQKLKFPQSGYSITKIRDLLGKKLELTEEIQKARNKFGQGVFYLNVLRSINFLVERELLQRINGKVCKTSNKSSFLLSNDNISGEDAQPPDESIEENYQKLRDELATELLQQIMEDSPAFFEKLVIDLLVKMGYGGSQEDAGKAVGGSGDGGIDGIIKEDPLGLDVIYIQAKRWGQGNIGRPEIAQFAGAIGENNASKGIFITTSDFTKDAKSFTFPGIKIILIDGQQLAQLMIEHNVGVFTVEIYEIKRVDIDYFDETS